MVHFVHAQSFVWGFVTIILVKIKENAGLFPTPALIGKVLFPLPYVCASLVTNMSTSTLLNCYDLF